MAHSVRDSAKELAAAAVAAFGIGPDETPKQKKFNDKYALGFPLLPDAKHKVAQASYNVKPQETVLDATKALV